MTHEHIVKKFDKNLDKIKAATIEMGALVCLQINDSTEVLSAYDAVEVDRIVAYDRVINGLYKDIYDRAEILIVRRQPVALDLRQTLAPINIAGELERIGNHAKSTARCARHIQTTSPDCAALNLIIQMSVLVQSMLEDVLIAYRNADIELAARIRVQDKKVDELDKQLVKTVIETLSKTPSMAERLIHLSVISRNFERIGDHIWDIARYVHKIVTGEDLKASIHSSDPRTDK